jgi:hypothetical protein
MNNKTLIDALRIVGVVNAITSLCCAIYLGSESTVHGETNPLIVGTGIGILFQGFCVLILFYAVAAMLEHIVKMSQEMKSLSAKEDRL